MAITIGTQPPNAILMVFAEKSDASTAKKTTVIGTMWASDQFQRDRATTAKSREVIAIVPVTAMPYAAPIDCDDLKNRTRSRQPNPRILLISGMKICPAS